MNNFTILTVLCILNIVLQALDGVLTYIGVSLYSSGIEGNPVVKFVIENMGIGVGLVTVKTIAIGLLVFIITVRLGENFDPKDFYLYLLALTVINGIYIWVVGYWIAFLSQGQACKIIW